MPAFGISYCTDLLLEEHGEDLCAIMGPFDAYTLFEPAVTLVAYEEAGGLSEKEIMQRCKAVLSCHGAMDFFRASSKQVHGESNLPHAFSPGEGAFGKTGSERERPGKSSCVRKLLGRASAEAPGCGPFQSPGGSGTGMAGAHWARAQSGDAQTDRDKIIAEKHKSDEETKPQNKRLGKHQYETRAAGTFEGHPAED